jgi:hypothetical protein
VLLRLVTWVIAIAHIGLLPRLRLLLERPKQILEETAVVPLRLLPALLLIVVAAAESAKPLGLGRPAYGDRDRGKTGAFGGSQKGRPDEPPREPDFAKHADRPRP